MQFRDDFQSAPYGKEYNTLVELALEDGRIIGQGCPIQYNVLPTNQQSPDNNYFHGHVQYNDGEALHI
jgi:hypothetical protein